MRQLSQKPEINGLRPWFRKDAILAFADHLRPDSPKFWGDDGVFPLMPVALLALTEPVLRVKLSPDQARNVREVLTHRNALRVGTFRFDSLYRADSEFVSLAGTCDSSAARRPAFVLKMPHRTESKHR